MGNRIGRLAAATRVAAAALVLLSVAAAEARAQQWVPIRSGLPWASGANGGKGGMADLEAMRGRPLDLRTVFTRTDTWDGIVASAPGVRAHLATGARIAIAVAMLPETHREQHMACWQHRFAPYIRAFGISLINAGGAEAIIRLGWEANRPNGYPWAVGDDRAAYKGCFRKWVNTLRSLPGQRFVIDWAMQDKSGYPAAEIYPGNDWVDIIGINSYDRCAPARTEEEWSRWLNARHGDGVNPRGPATWLAFAQARGKKLSFPEWGIGGPSPVKFCTEPGIDNPFFVRKMHAFFRANAGSLAYEAYFNGHGDGRSDGNQGSVKLAPTYYNPRSAAEYKRLWGLLTP